MLIDKDSLIIDGVKMAQYLISAKFGYHKIWGKDTGRALSGDNSGTLKGIYPKITMTFRKLNEEEVGIILSLFNKAENKVTFYNPDLKKTIKNMSCYSNDQEMDQKYLGRVENYSCAVISNKKREHYV
ncbi:MAG: hypothetical protein HFJ30_10495 [Clostridia bacterium]|jgi:hypothetical protein|nr:hypothetical protein [Clostridia bacterium]